MVTCHSPVSRSPPNSSDAATPSTRGSLLSRISRASYARLKRPSSPTPRPTPGSFPASNSDLQTQSTSVHSFIYKQLLGALIHSLTRLLTVFPIHPFNHSVTVYSHSFTHSLTKLLCGLIPSSLPSFPNSYGVPTVRRQ